MNKNYKYFVLLFVLLIIGISCAHATNETDVSSSDATVTASDVAVNTNVNKEITKTNIKDNTVKTANVTEVNSYSALETELTDKSSDKIINLKKGTYKISHQIKMYDKGFTRNIVINGNGATLDGSNSQSFLIIFKNNKVTINDLNIKNAKGTSGAGGVVVNSQSSLTLNNCNFTNVVSTGIGGAVTNMGTTTVNNCVFTGTTARNGAAIWSTGENKGYLRVENSKFINNKANYQNNYDKTGVIYVITGSSVKTNILNNVFENNNGRAIHTFKANSLISGNTFKNIVLNAPSTTIRGAVLDNYESNVNIVNNVFTNIKISAKNVKGGLLYNEIGTSSFESNTITGLSVSATERTDSLNGGILFNRNSALTVSDNTITNVNKGYRVHGGDLYNNNGRLYVYNNNFNPSNTASYLIRGKYIYNDRGGLVNYGGNNFKGGETNIYNLGTSKEVVPPIAQKATVITVNPVNGVIGNEITFVANVKDINGNAVTGGNVVFKVNGKTLRTDGSLNASKEANKVSVANGIAKITVTATKDVRGAKTISASYSGSAKYYANSTKTTATANLKLRNAILSVSATPSTGKQYETIKFTAKITDVTKNTKTSTPMKDDSSYVIFKINGVTLKDNNGKQVQVKVNNGIATYNYVVPAGMAAITKDKKIRYYNVTAVYASSNYYPGARNNTQFNVLRGNVTIQPTKYGVNTTKRTLLVKGNIKDIKNKNVLGTNKLGLKINGKTVLINNATTMDVTNGTFIIYMKIPSNIKVVKNITLVTGARMAYQGYRTTLLIE